MLLANRGNEENFGGMNGLTEVAVSSSLALISGVRIACIVEVVRSAAI
jgi:hypothetical protein